jgi:hypothetical protein
MARAETSLETVFFEVGNVQLAVATFVFQAFLPLAFFLVFFLAFHA